MYYLSLPSQGLPPLIEWIYRLASEASPPPYEMSIPRSVCVWYPPDTSYKVYNDRTLKFTHFWSEITNWKRHISMVQIHQRFSIFNLIKAMHRRVAMAMTAYESLCKAVLRNVIRAEGRMADSQNVASTLQLFMRSNRKEAILTSTPTYELLDP